MSACLLLGAAGSAHAASLTVYDGALENNFADYFSWATTYSFANTSTVRGSETHSISFKPDNWGGVRVLANNGNTRYPFADYGSLTFWVNGGSGSGQKINLSFQLNDTANNQSADYGSFDIASNTSGGITAATWKQVTINFDSTSFTYGAFNQLVFQANSSTSATQPQVYFTDIVFNARSTAIATGAVANVSIDTHTVGNLINPLIFGVAYGDGTRNAQIGYSVRRWGGNSTTRYNWQVDVNSTASDYYFENIPNSTDRTHVPPLNNSADQFISEAKNAGAHALITIPTIGWTPRSDSTVVHPYTVGFSVAKYGPQQAVDNPWDLNAGNGIHTNGSPITGNDPTDSSQVSDPAFEQGWIAHLQSAFGSAAGGGVRYYTLDNEVMLWNSTHRDVHPAPPDENEIWGTALSYGKAIKQQEPNARVTGPVTWGYCDLFWSAKDNCGTSNADRNLPAQSGFAAHGGLPFVAWYLQQNCANGRPVDYLDLHYYPQGANIALTNDDSPATAGLRVRSLKELYDPAWVSQSWISNLGNSTSDHLSTPGLLPRVHGWISTYCPNTKLAITEYNWGNDDTTSGAIAQAEALAIFARDGLDLATRWVAPAPQSISENAYSIFLNYDGAGSKVSGNSVAAKSSNADQVGAYAFDIPGQRTMILLTNKDVAVHDAALSFGTARNGTWKRYAFTGASNLAQIGSSSAISGTSLTVSALPPMSATLVVVSNLPVGYVPLVPARLLDTRAGTATVDDASAGIGAIGAKGTTNLSVLGRGGVPSTGVSAVVLNLTVTGPTAAGFVTAWPSGSARPAAASNLNFTTGETISNLAIVKVDATGQVSLFNSAGTTHLVADVVGYFTDTSQLASVVPARLLDTRPGTSTIDGQFVGGGALGVAGILNLTIAGRDGLPGPGSVGAAVLNVTAVTPTANGFATIWPTGAARPATSNINFAPGDIVPNLVISQVGSGGQVTLFNSKGATHYVADLVGWFPSTSELTPVGPARLLDTRAGTTTVDGTFAGTGSLAAKGTLDLLVLGRGGVPASGVGAVVLNLTATGTTAAGFISAWPTGNTRPNASNVNFVSGQTISNLAIGKVGTGGKITLFNSAGSTDIVADVVGWLPASP